MRVGPVDILGALQDPDERAWPRKEREVAPEKIIEWMDAEDGDERRFCGTRRVDQIEGTDCRSYHGFTLYLRLYEWC